MGRRCRGTLLVLCLAILIVRATREEVLGPGPGPDPVHSQVPSAVLEMADAERLPAGEVTLLGPWTGPDLDSFWAVARPFCQRHGMRVTFESTPNVPSVLASRLEAGAPPDIVVLPGLGLVSEHARAGHLVPLARVVDVAALSAQCPAGWLDQASLDGQLYGLPYRVSNESIVWYNAEEFRRRNWTIPLTWAEMVALSDRIAGSGLAPWALALDERTGRGEAGTDWIENILLRASGPEAYDRWVRHEIPWTDAAVREAFLRWGQIVGRPRNLSGGARSALRLDQAEAMEMLYQNIPQAYLHLQGSSALPLIGRRAGREGAIEEYDFFALPPLRLEDDPAVVAGTEALALLRATPQSVALLRHLASPQAQATWVRRGAFLPATGEVELGQYPDPLSRRAARQLAEAPVVRLDASEQMPTEVRAAFRGAVCDFVADPGRLNSILASVERVARAAYGKRPATASDGVEPGRAAGQEHPRGQTAGCEAVPGRVSGAGARGGAP
ncbi:MAG: extracellular solute-binding protein [Anaerolineae bacterium]|nr:extracellular solute-binding protein [Anaerolineae bacterium]